MKKNKGIRYSPEITEMILLIILPMNLSIVNINKILVST